MLVRDGGKRQIWSFSFGGKPYFLYFYPREKGLLQHGRSGSALIDFVHYQALQRAGVSSPRAVAQLSGFKIDEKSGDALIVQGLRNAVQLDRHLQDCRNRGIRIRNRHKIAGQIARILHDLGKAKFGCRDLGLDRFLIADETVYLHDVRGMRAGGLRQNDLFTLAHDAARFATRGELLRVWNTLNPEFPPPRKNPVSHALWRSAARQCRGDNDDFGSLHLGDWSGYFSKKSRHAEPWSVATTLRIDRNHWQSAWPDILERMQKDQFTVIKRDASGDVLSGEITLAGRTIDAILKRPKRKFWHGYFADLARPSRAMRTWEKSWMLIARNLPCEWPLLVMQRGPLGYAFDSMVLFERVPGETLAKIDLNAINPADRANLFFRAGRTLRSLEQMYLAHGDAKNTNWIAFNHPGLGPLPVMLDAYGIEPLRFGNVARGIQRLLRAMKTHPHYTPADSLALCRGYAPFAGRIEPEQQPGE